MYYKCSCRFLEAEVLQLSWITGRRQAECVHVEGMEEISPGEGSCEYPNHWYRKLGRSTLYLLPREVGTSGRHIPGVLHP